MLPPSRKKILIADDDPTILMLVRTIVEAEGFTGLIASNGKIAYKLIRDEKDICGAIVDNKMPYIEGVGLVRFMRDDDKVTKFPIVIMTGEAGIRTSERARESGAVAFLPKPFTNSQLRTVLSIFGNSP